MVLILADAGRLRGECGPAKTYDQDFIAAAGACISAGQAGGEMI
jgi:hypothetical protein